MLQAPCKDCPDRRVGCHSVCDKYIEYDASRKKFLAKRQEIRATEYEWWKQDRFRKYRKMRK